MKEGWRQGTARSLLQCRRVLPRAEGIHKRKNGDEIPGQNAEDYLTNWIWWDSKEGE